MFQRILSYAALLLLPLLAACNLSTTAPDNTTQVPPDTTNNGTFFVYINNPQTGELIRVSSDGTQTSFDLGLADESYASSYDMSFSADGSRVAFCQTTYEPNSPISTATLYIRDVIAQSNITTVDFGSGEGKMCTLGQQAFVDNQVAVSIMNSAPFSTTPDPSVPVWELRIVDATTGEKLSSIDASANPMPELDEQFGGAPLLPIVVRYTGTDVIFMFIPYGGDGFFDAPAYIWNVASGSVTATAYWGKTGMDALDTGELVFPDNDPNLPAGQPMGPTGMFNVLRVADGGEPRTIYHVADSVIGGTQFINHGQQIAVMLFPTFDPDNPNVVGNTRWIAIDRAGAVTELLSTPYYAQLLPAPNGFVALEQAYEDGDFQRGTYILSYTNNGNRTVLWESGAPGSTTWELAWVTPTEIASDLAPFPAFTP